MTLEEAIEWGEKNHKLACSLKSENRRLRAERDFWKKEQDSWGVEAALQMKRADSLEKELDVLKAMIFDPVAMWVNYLRGAISLPIERMENEVINELRTRLKEYEKGEA